MTSPPCIEASAIRALVIHLADKEPGEKEWDDQHRGGDCYVDQDVGKTRHGVLIAKRPFSVRA